MITRKRWVASEGSDPLGRFTPFQYDLVDEEGHIYVSRTWKSPFLVERPGKVNADRGG